MESLIVDLVKADRARWRALGVVEALGVPSACIGAGFVRNLVWDHLHGRANDCRKNDLDVLWFDRARTDRQVDRELTGALQRLDPTFDWSVRNQARMHERNEDAPYRSVSDAMRHWAETATAIAVRRARDECEIIAPFGLDDLMSMILRPTSSAPHKLKAFTQRAQDKDWPARWPGVRVAIARAPREESPAR